MSERKLLQSCPGCQAVFRHATGRFVYYMCGSKVDEKNEFAVRTLQCRLQSLEQRVTALEKPPIEPVEQEDPGLEKLRVLAQAAVEQADPRLCVAAGEVSAREQPLKEAAEQPTTVAGGIWADHDVAEGMQALGKCLQEVGSNSRNYPDVHTQAIGVLKYLYSDNQTLRAQAEQSRRERDKAYQDNKRLSKERDKVREQLEKIQAALDGEDEEGGDDE